MGTGRELPVIALLHVHSHLSVDFGEKASGGELGLHQFYNQISLHKNLNLGLSNPAEPGSSLSLIVEIGREQLPSSIWPMDARE
jgi:hypothetical protein